MSAHLGHAVTAFVDGELSDERREQVLTHLTHCACCRAEVAEVRRLKSTLRGSDGPSVPFDLSFRLLAVSALPPPPVPVRRTPAARRAALPHGLRRTAVGGAFLVLGLGGALSLAGPPPRGPVAPVDPTSPRFVFDHGATSTEVPFTGLDMVSVSSR
jgi:anti-sigma factor RsiW